MINGKFITIPGDGICWMSNLLFWMFPRTPLTVIRRRGHEVKGSPEPSSDEIKGVDVTILKDWADLEVQNDTDCTYWVWVILGDEKIISQVPTDKGSQTLYEVTNGSIRYVRESGGIYEYTQVKRI